MNTKELQKRESLLWAKIEDKNIEVLPYVRDLIEITLEIERNCNQ